MIDGKRVKGGTTMYNAEKTLQKTLDEVPLDIVDDIIVDRPQL